MKKILATILSLTTSTLLFSNTTTPKNSLVDETAKKAYLMTNDIKGEYRTISLNEVKEMLDKKEAILLDVRNPEELKNDGYINPSINIPLGELENRIGELDKEETYITFCAVGGRSAKAAAILSNKGFNKIYNAKEGIKAWPYEKQK